MRLARYLVLALGSVFIPLASLPASAQTNKNQATNDSRAQATSRSDFAVLAGTLTDPSGAAISAATVSAEPAGPAGQSETVESGPDGSFSLRLAPGQYRVIVSDAPFERMERVFTLDARESRTWDVRLGLAALSSNVIVTAAAEPERATSTVSSVDVITSQEISRRQAIFLTPMLASVPGMSFSQLGPVGGSTTFFLDGGNANYTKVLIDGVPVNQPGGLVDFSGMALDGIDKVEVVHGAASALYGSDAMAGVIQIFTHRGTTRQPVLELEGDGGTFGTGHGGGQLSGLLGSFDYSLGAGYISSDGQGPGHFFRDTTLSGTFGWKFSSTDTLRLSLRNASSDAGQPGQTLLEPPALGQSTGLHDFSAGLAWDFDSGDHLQNHLSGFESRYDEIGVFSNGPGANPPLGSFETKFNRAGLNAQSTYLFPEGGVTAGYEFEVENGGATARHNQAGYLEARYQPARRLTLTAGGRVEANGFFGTRAVPRVGAMYLLRQGNSWWGATRLRASYGLGIKEPDLLPPDCGPQLAPERSRTVDAGVDQELASGRIRFSAVYFDNNFRDIVSFAFGGSNPNCPAFDGSYFNTDEARARGVNSSLEMKPAGWLNIVGNYTYDDSRVLKTTNPLDDPALAVGNRLFKRPLHSADLIANASFRRINFNLGGYYVGRRTDSDFLGLGYTSDPSYVRWDFAAILPLRYGLSVNAKVQNLFDRRYSDAIGYPALGRNFRLGMKFVWGGKE